MHILYVCITDPGVSVYPGISLHCSNPCVSLCFVFWKSMHCNFWKFVPGPREHPRTEQHGPNFNLDIVSLNQAANHIKRGVWCMVLCNQIYSRNINVTYWAYEYSFEMVYLKNTCSLYNPLYGMSGSCWRKKKFKQQGYRRHKSCEEQPFISRFQCLFRLYMLRVSIPSLNACTDLKGVIHMHLCLKKK